VLGRFVDEGQWLGDLCLVRTRTRIRDPSKYRQMKTCARFVICVLGLAACRAPNSGGRGSDILGRRERRAWRSAGVVPLRRDRSRGRPAAAKGTARLNTPIAMAIGTFRENCARFFELVFAARRARHGEEKPLSSHPSR
jgi:hypothetical protein